MIFLAVVAVIVVLLWRRHARKNVLAGRDVEKPVYMTERPTRRMGKLKDSRL